MNDRFTDELTELRTIIDLAPDMVALSEWTGAVRYVNPAGRALVGMPDDWKPYDTTTDQFFTPAGLEISDDVEKSLAEDGSWRGLGELRHFRTGEPIAVAITTFVIDNGAGAPKSLATIVRDRRLYAEHDLKLQRAVESSARYAAEQGAIANLSRLAINADLADLLTAAGAAAVDSIGVDHALITRVSEAENDDLSIVVHTGAPVESTEISWDSLVGHTELTRQVIVSEDRSTETRFSTVMMEQHSLRSGVGVPIEPSGVISVYSNDVRRYSARDIAFLGTVADVLSAAFVRHDLYSQLRSRSLHDPLTGLLNRAGAYESIDRELARAAFDGSIIAILLLDLDDLKIINDSLGHDAGDIALEQFAGRLASAVPSTHSVARIGGDEFLVVGEVEDTDHARRLARTIIGAMAAATPDSDAPRPLSASIGISVSEPGTSRRELIHRADLAMYRAKDSGAGGFAVFDGGDIYDAERLRTLSNDLRAALDNDDLTLDYQPIYDLNTGAIASMEALARWTHPVQGPIGPTEFIAVAERTGLIVELGAWALCAACTEASRWWHDHKVSVRVNVSALQLHDPEFPAYVAAVLNESDLPAEAVGLEITETMWVADTARMTDVITTLHKMGVGLLLDDFGKGHSSISYLERYPMFECFKIDKSYIDGLPAPRPYAIVSAIVSLAKAFDVNVVAEGVETSEQLAAVTAIGCNLAQGYLLSRPVSAELATRMLEAAPTA